MILQFENLFGFPERVLWSLQIQCGRKKSGEGYSGFSLTYESPDLGFFGLGHFFTACAL